MRVKFKHKTPKAEDAYRDLLGAFEDIHERHDHKDWFIVGTPDLANLFRLLTAYEKALGREATVCHIARCAALRSGIRPRFIAHKWAAVLGDLGRAKREIRGR